MKSFAPSSAQPFTQSFTKMGHMTLALIVIGQVLFSGVAKAAHREENVCVRKSKAAVLADAKAKIYFIKKVDGSGNVLQRKISRAFCEPSKFVGKPAKFCQVSAGFGAEVGAGDVSFLVILDQSCSQVISVGLIGEE